MGFCLENLMNLLLLCACVCVFVNNTDWLEDQDACIGTINMPVFTQFRDARYAVFCCRNKFTVI